MAPLRNHAFAWAVYLQLALLLSGCISARAAGAPTSAMPPAAPSGSLWTNTFPPIKSNDSALRFAHYGLEEGLSQSTVEAIFQDNLGFLWIGTQDGLNRFDGYSFKIFRPNPNDAHSISGGEIYSIAQGADDAIWVGTNEGLDRYDPVTGEFRYWAHDDRNPDSLIEDNVQVVYQDSQSRLWVGTRKGLDEFDPVAGKFRHLTMSDKESGTENNYSIHALYEDQAGTLWIGTDDGLMRYSLADQRLQVYQSNSGDTQSLSFNEVSSISEDPQGLLWVGTHAGLSRLDPATGKFTRFSHSDTNYASLADDYVLSTYVDRAGELWVGTRNGLDRFDPASQQFIAYQNDPTDPGSLSNNSVDSIYEDRGGALWIGTGDGGLNLHDRSQDRFAYYHHVNADPYSLSGDVIFPIVPAANGKVWIGTYQAGLNLFDPETGRSKHYRHDAANPDSLLNDIVISLLLDKNGTLWVGTYEGLDRLDAGSSKFVHYVYNADDPNSLPFGPVYKIYQDSQGTYWIGTAKGVRIFNPYSAEFVKVHASGPDAAGLSDSPARAIYQDRNGIMWLGTDTHGLFRFDPTTRQLQQYTRDPNNRNSISANTVMQLYEDSRGTLWIGTFGGGLNRYVPEQNAFVSFRQEQGLPNDVVYGILEDDTGHLWLSTNLGISKFDVSRGTFQNFTVKDGLQSNEFDGSAFARDTRGRMYFGGVKGLTVFEPGDIQTNRYVPPVVFTSLTTQDGKPAAAQTAETLKEVTLPSPQNSFDLSFAALSFSQAAKNQYKYKLVGFDQEWRSAGSDHRGSYTNLPGGTYTLHVVGSNSDGIWNQVGAAIKVTVIPPFWQTWLFRGLAGMGLILLALLVYQTRVRGIQAQKIELEHVILDRTRVLKKQNLDLEALYSADEKMLRVITQEEVLQALVDVAVDILQADKSAVFTQGAAQDEYTARVSRGFLPDTVQSADFAESQQAILANVAEGEPLIIGDTANDARWQQQRPEIVEKMSAEGVRSLMYIPIKVQNTVLGVFNICSSQPGAFNEDHQRLFAALVQRAALSIENSRLFEQTKQLAIIEERNRLAQDLHDSAKQKAFAALAQLGAAKKLATQNQGTAREHVVEAENIVSEVIRDLNFFIQESYPRELKDKGLGDSLRDYAFTWESRSGIQLNLSVTGECPLPLQTEQALYRIVLEGLSNIARHSQATQAEVRVAYQEQDIQIEISDNGRGFDAATTADGLGLRLIRERLEGIGGRVDIQSRRGGGTLLMIHAPLHRQE